VLHQNVESSIIEKAKFQPVIVARTGLGRKIDTSSWSVSFRLRGQSGADRLALYSVFGAHENNLLLLFVTILVMTAAGNGVAFLPGLDVGLSGVCDPSRRN